MKTELSERERDVVGERVCWCLVVVFIGMFAHLRFGKGYVLGLMILL